MGHTMRPGFVSTKCSGIRNANEGQVEGKTITITFPDPEWKRDNWGRLLCTIEVDGSDVGEALIEAGFAVPWE